MAEGKTGSTPAAAPASSDQPGRPYYETLRTSLRQAIQRKDVLDAELAAIEERIHREETAYLEETSSAGNIVRGFDNWVKGVVVGASSVGDRKAGRTSLAHSRIRDEDRIFSRSSISWIKSQEGPTEPPSVATSSPGTGTQTPSGAAPPIKISIKSRKKSTAAVASAVERDDEDEAKPAKRTKISYAVAT